MPYALIKLTASRALWLFFLVVLGISVLIISIASTYFESRSVRNLAEEEARQTSKLVFQNLYSVMERGWDRSDIDRVLNRLSDVIPDADVSLMRAQKVAEQFGPGPKQVDDHRDDALVLRVLESGKEKSHESNGELRFIYPVKAKSECLGCHTNAAVGDINGLIEVKFSLEHLQVPLEYMLQSIFLIFSFIFIGVAALAFFAMHHWLISPITELASHMREIEAVDEMTDKVKTSRLRISEVNILTEEFHYLLHKLSLIQKRLQDRSERDPLTGLYNRRYLDERLNEEIARSQRYDHSMGLLMVDLNKFKPINDNYGHEAGDAVLVEVSRVMSGIIRNSDIITRVGGDEFIVIVPETEEAEIYRLAEKLSDTVRRTTVTYENNHLSVGASIGIAIYPRDGRRGEQLLRQADVSMYKDKKRWHAMSQ